MKRKTRKSLARRVKITKTGKVLIRTQNMRHLRRKKSKSQIRRMKRIKQLKGALRLKILKMMGVR